MLSWLLCFRTASSLSLGAAMALLLVLPTAALFPGGGADRDRAESAFLELSALREDAL